MKGHNKALRFPGKDFKFASCYNYAGLLIKTYSRSAKKIMKPIEKRSFLRMITLPGAIILFITVFI